MDFFVGSRKCPQGLADGSLMIGTKARKVASGYQILVDDRWIDCYDVIVVDNSSDERGLRSPYESDF